MEEEQKVRKYENVKTDNATIIEMDKGILAMAVSKSKRVEDGKIFAGVRLFSGYRGKFGFMPNKINGVVELPMGMKSRDWDKLESAYNEQVKQLQ